MGIGVEATASTSLRASHSALKLTLWTERAWATGELKKGSSVWSKERPCWDLASKSQTLNEVGEGRRSRRSFNAFCMFFGGVMCNQARREAPVCPPCLCNSAQRPAVSPPATKVDTTQRPERLPGPKPRPSVIARRPGVAGPCKLSPAEPLHHLGHAKGAPRRPLQEPGQRETRLPPLSCLPRLS